MRHSPIPSTLFSDRRKEFAKKMAPDSIAVFYSNDPMPRSGDQFYPFRQDSALYALTGIDQPGTILLLYPDAKNKIHREMVFIQPCDLEHAIWNGDRLNQKDAAAISGIATIRWIGQWETIMPSLFYSVNSIYVNTREQEKFDSPLLSLNDRMAAELKNLYPFHTFHRAQPLLKQMLMIKHPVELELIKKAVTVTGLAFQRVLQTIRPGMREYEVEAELSYEMLRNGCQHAFEPIVASGVSACTLHYIKNDQVIAPDSLVLLDFGAEYANMASDMTRTIPASGRFSKTQKKIYQAVLNVLNETMKMMSPGMTLESLNKETGKKIESELISLKILTKSEIKRQDLKSPLWRKYFMHGVSHHLGYDVHDIGDRTVPFKAGMVLTCEPGIYIPELKTGVRLENDILITRRGSENLMKSIPVDPDEIETLMNSKTK